MLRPRFFRVIRKERVSSSRNKGTRGTAIGTVNGNNTMKHTLALLFNIRRQAARVLWPQVVALLSLALLGLGWFACRAAAADGRADVLGNWKCQLTEALMFAQGEGDDPMSTRAFKQELLHGLTKAEAQKFVKLMLSVSSNTPSPERCEAAAKLWLPRFIDCVGMPQSSPPQVGLTDIDWSSVKYRLGVCLLSSRVSWGGRFIGHRIVAKRKGQLPAPAECWRIVSDAVDGRSSIHFGLIPNGGPSTNDDVVVRLQWDQRFLPSEDAERSWACLRVAASIGVATEGLLPMEVCFVNSLTLGDAPIRIEVFGKGRLLKDFTQSVAAALNQVPPEAREALQHNTPLENSLERAIDPMLLELLKVVLDSGS